MSERGTIGIVGATGAVGREALAILAARGVEAERIVALASPNSDGAALAYGNGQVIVQRFRELVLSRCACAIFCADAQVAREFGPAAARAGVVVVDNSSAFRMDPSVPLVVPEINGHLLDESGASRLIANPNCSTIIMLLGLEPLRRRFGVREVVVSTYQAVSGAGLAGIRELEEQTRGALSGARPQPRVFAQSCAFNVLTHESAMDEATGINGEEAKMIAETRKIWEDESVEVLPTCVRVPVMRAHSQSILATLGREASEDDVRAAMAAAPGVRLVDDRAAGRFPTPMDATGRNEVLVGRVRVAGGGKGPRVMLWVCGDQLRKGAALNALQIAERCLPGLTRSARAVEQAAW